MNTLEINKTIEHIDDDFIILHHYYGENKNYKVAIKPNEIIGIEEDESWGNKTHIMYRNQTTHVVETFDEIMNIIKEFNRIKSKKVLNESNYGGE